MKRESNLLIYYACLPFRSFLLFVKWLRQYSLKIEYILYFLCYLPIYFFLHIYKYIGR